MNQTLGLLVRLLSAGRAPGSSPALSSRSLPARSMPSRLRRPAVWYSVASPAIPSVMMSCSFPDQMGRPAFPALGRCQSARGGNLPVVHLEQWWGRTMRPSEAMPPMMRRKLDGRGSTAPLPDADRDGFLRTICGAVLHYPFGGVVQGRAVRRGDRCRFRPKPNSSAYLEMRLTPSLSASVIERVAGHGDGAVDIH